MQVLKSLMNRGHCITAVYANYSSLMSYYTGCNSLAQPNNKKQGHSFSNSSFPANTSWVLIAAKQYSLIVNEGSFMARFILSGIFVYVLLLALFSQAFDSVMSLHLKRLWAQHPSWQRWENSGTSTGSQQELTCEKEKLASHCWLHKVLCRQMGQQRELVLFL